MNFTFKYRRNENNYYWKYLDKTKKTVSMKKAADTARGQFLRREKWNWEKNTADFEIILHISALGRRQRKNSNKNG